MKVIMFRVDLTLYTFQYTFFPWGYSKEYSNIYYKSSIISNQQPKQWHVSFLLAVSCNGKAMMKQKVHNFHLLAAWSTCQMDRAVQALYNWHQIVNTTHCFYFRDRCGSSFVFRVDNFDARCKSSIRWCCGTVTEKRCKS